jgi:pimeloyl-ACP methyl ester carboxylesterase
MLKVFAPGLISVILFLNSVFGITHAHALQLKASHPAPGRLIDIGGYNLHILCEGAGEPTVLMEAGLGNPGLAWTLVQPEVARDTQVCVYDRAGLGWSDPSPRERTANVMVEELHELLTYAGIEPPYVMVGHSFGGLLMRMYAHAYPNEVVGLVLVDSYHYTQMERYPRVHGQGNPMLLLALRTLDLTIRSGIPTLQPSLLPALDLEKLPSETLATYRDLLAADPKSVRAAQAELNALPASSQQEKAAGIRSLGNIPLVVLSHAYLEARPLDPIGEKHHGEYEVFWRADQGRLASLSPQGRLVIASASGHYIQLDEPDLVIRAVENVLGEIRA